MTLWILGIENKDRGWGALYTWKKNGQSNFIFENEEFSNQYRW